MGVPIDIREWLNVPSRSKGGVHEAVEIITARINIFEVRSIFTYAYVLLSRVMDTGIVATELFGK